jgi:hypothetical protein
VCVCVCVRVCVCVCVAFVIHRARRITVLYCHLWPVRLHHILPHHLIKGSIFGKTFLNKKCVFWFSLPFFSEILLFLRRIHRNTITNVNSPLCNLPVLLVRFYRNWNFRERFLKNSQISIFMEILPVGAEFFHVYEETDRQTLGS